MLRQQVRRNLGVRLRGELNTSLCKFIAQPGKVFDNTVMNEGNRAVSTDVRMRVDVGGTAMGCPSRMTDPEGGRFQRIRTEQALQVG